MSYAVRHVADVTRARFFGCLAFLALATQGRNADAEECPVSPSIGLAPRVTAFEARERLAFIDQSMASGVGPARRHTYGWGGLQVASMAVNGTLLILASEETRPDRAVALATATVGLGATVVSYPLLLRNQVAVARLASPDAIHHECVRLAEAESRLVATAESEASSRSWFRHVLNIAFNGAMAVVLGVGYERWSAAGLQGISLGIGEAILFTRPTTAIDALARYRAGDLHAAPSARSAFAIELSATWLGFSGTF